MTRTRITQENTMNDYKHSARPQRDPDAIVGFICKIGAAVVALMLWAGAI